MLRSGVPKIEARQRRSVTTPHPLPASHAASLAGLRGADYVKVDYCGYCAAAPCKDPRDISIEPGVQYAAFAALRDALNRTGRHMYLSICPHTASNGRGTQAPFSMLYTPPPSWSTAQRHALANSVLAEYSNTPDQWAGGIAGGITANIDAMLDATRLSDASPGYWNVRFEAGTDFSCEAPFWLEPPASDLGAGVHCVAVCHNI